MRSFHFETLQQEVLKCETFVKSMQNLKQKITYMIQEGLSAPSLCLLEQKPS
jgi:hypothetical protein